MVDLVDGRAEATVSVDVAIVGAGPTGLYAAYYAGFRGLTVAVVDSLHELGGQVIALYPEKPIYDVAGFPSIRGRDLVQGLVDQAAPFATHVILGQQALRLDTAADGGFVLETDQATRVKCRAVVVTGGIGTFKPRPLPAGEEFLGRGLMYFVPTLDALEGTDVVIVGGGDSAVDWALALEDVARSVTLVHRRDSFRAHQHSVERLRASSVRVMTHGLVRSLRGGAWLEEVDVERAKGEIETLKSQAVVAALGFTASLGPVADWGMTLRNRHILVDSRMATSRPGVFAAGDITDYDGKVRLISVAFGEAATAVNNAVTFLDPDADLFPGHSTDVAPPAGVA